MKHIPSRAALLLVASFAASLAACASVNPVTHAPGQVANATVAVQYDAASHTFTVSDRTDGKAFVKNGQLDGAGIILREEAATDPVFGVGRRIVVARTGGGEIALEVYPDLPFALVRETVTNTTAKAVDFQKVVPAAFTLDLGKPVSALTTMGTGGLLAPDKNPGSYLFLTCADPATRRGVVAGWVTQYKGSGTVFSSVNRGQVAFKAQTEHGHLILQPGKSAALDIFAVGNFNDARLGEEALASAIAKAHHIHLRPKQAVYMTWYAEGPGHGGAGTQENTVELAKFCAKERLQAYGLGYVQIDDQWQDGPQINGPARHFGHVNPKGPYAGGIAPVASAVQAEGLGFGLWWMPFSRNHMEPDFKNKQNWFWKRPNGAPLRQNQFGGTCLDASVPEVAKELETLGRLLRSWGVTYYKMDGFSTGAGVDQVYINDGYKNDHFGQSLPAHDPTLTHIEVMRQGIGHIRRGAGEDVFFSACAASQNMRMYAGALGLVDSMRVGPDFNHDHQGIRSGPLRGSRMYFLNGKVWWNDPDPTKVRTSNERVYPDGSATGGVTLAQARLTSSWAALTDQIFLVSDWLPNLPQERLDILKRTMAAHGATARPVDYFDNSLANTWLVSSDASGVRREVVGLFNFYDKPLGIDRTFAKMGLAPQATYHAFDFWADQPVADLADKVSATVAPMSCQVLALRAKTDHPVLISTSRHVSSGILEVKEEKWSGNTLSGGSEVIANDSYELRITGLHDGGKQWVPSTVFVSDADATAGVKISQTLEAGLLRVKITSSTGRMVKWGVKFTSEDLQPEKIQAVRAAVKGPYDPVILTWESNAQLHTITRDGKVIATGHFGESYVDKSASRGKTHTYTVAVEGGKALSAEPVAMPDFPPPPPIPDVKLASLKPLVLRNGYGAARFGKAVDGGPLTVSGHPCANGVGLHAPAQLGYARAPEWKRFVAHIGLNESQRAIAATTIVCKVISENAAGEKKDLATSPLLCFDGVEEFGVNVALPADCVKVHLLVEDGGDGIRCDHVNWENAGFVK